MGLAGGGSSPRTAGRLSWGEVAQVCASHPDTAEPAQLEPRIKGGGCAVAMGNPPGCPHGVLQASVVICP